MKLLKYTSNEDFGRNIYLSILEHKGWCVLDAMFYTFYYGKTFPHLSIVLGSGRLLGIYFSFLKFGINLEFICRTY